MFMCCPGSSSSSSVLFTFENRWFLARASRATYAYFSRPIELELLKETMRTMWGASSEEALWGLVMRRVCPLQYLPGLIQRFKLHVWAEHSARDPLAVFKIPTVFKCDIFINPKSRSRNMFFSDRDCKVSSFAFFHSLLFFLNSRMKLAENGKKIPPDKNWRLPLQTALKKWWTNSKNIKWGSLDNFWSDLDLMLIWLFGSELQNIWFLIP